MSSMMYSQKMFKPTAPEKGSFPLDHEGECKRAMLGYMSCMLQAAGESSACRESARAYLDCRMQHGLMATESWSSLGFHDRAAQSPDSGPAPADTPVAATVSS